jgi:SAM-dependent methyltransferase
MPRKAVFIVLLLASLSGLSFCSATPRVKTEPDVVFITTSHKVVKEMLKLAELRKDDVLYDLGSGDGRIVIAAARDFGAKAVGIEIDRDLISESTENAKKAGVAERTSFRKEDIFKTDIHEATVVTLFLLPGVNEMLRPKLFKELKPGTRVVSHRFDMGDWKPDVSLRGYGSDVYLWFIPTQVDGEWQITVYREKDPWRQIFRFHQAYQVVQGTDKEEKAEFKDIELYGKEIEMVIENNSVGAWSVMELTGHVEGNTMEGTVAVKGSPSAGEYVWKGVRIKNAP